MKTTEQIAEEAREILYKTFPDINSGAVIVAALIRAESERELALFRAKAKGGYNGG